MKELDFDVRTVRTERGVSVIARGELDLGTAHQLEAPLRELRAAAEPTLLDLSDLTFIDSTGLRLLLSLCEAANTTGWPIRMLRPAGDALTTIRRSGTERLFPFVEDQAA